MALEAEGEGCAGRGGTLLGEGDALQAAAHLARRVLNDGQAAGLHLRPIVGDVVEVLGIGRDLLEQGPGGLQGGQILLLLVLAAPLAHQAVVAQDALDGGVAQG